MTKTLVIIPTKDRLVPLNCLIQNLITQEGEFDIFIGDMSTEPNYLYDDWYLKCGLQRAQYLGHNYMVQRVTGTNQLYGYQAGLEYAKANGYDICIGGDDDLTYEPGFIKKGIEYMTKHPKCGCLAGYTLVPFKSIKEQTGTPDMFALDEFSGRLKDLGLGGYYHCIYLDPSRPYPREVELVYGGFFFRTADAVAVGGFPTHLSPFGFRGEMMLQTAILFSGKKHILHPELICYHYGSTTGGLRTIQGDFKKKCLEQDLNTWNIFVNRGIASTAPVDDNDVP